MKRNNILMVLTILTIVILSGCKSHKKIMPSDKARTGIETIQIGNGNKIGKKIVEESMTWIGTPYKYAAQTKGEGTDCSGMVMKVYEDITGQKLPRNSARQAEYCRKILPEEVKMGDLVFFATGKEAGKITHVGIIIDDSSFIHASTSKGVLISNLYSPYYKRTFIMFGRVPGVTL